MTICLLILLTLCLFILSLKDPEVEEKERSRTIKTLFDSHTSKEDETYE